MTALVELDSVTVRYGSACVDCARSDPPQHCRSCGAVLGCHRVSLDVRAGEVLGIVGESGSGKSTVLQVACLDQTPTAGRVRLDGVDLAGVTRQRRRELRDRLLGVVRQPDRSGLLLDVTAGGNVAVPLLAAGWRCYDAIRARVAELFDAVELDVARMDDPVVQYSGGMRQRVQLARALASSPRLLLLDEPTTGLDLSVQARILDLIRRLQRQTGVAMVVVSHDLGVVRMLTERVLVMRRGVVIESGVTDQVLSDPHADYTRLLVAAELA